MEQIRNPCVSVRPFPLLPPAVGVSVTRGLAAATDDPCTGRWRGDGGTYRGRRAVCRRPPSVCARIDPQSSCRL